MGKSEEPHPTGDLVLNGKVSVLVGIWRAHDRSRNFQITTFRVSRAIIDGDRERNAQSNEQKRCKAVFLAKTTSEAPFFNYGTLRLAPISSACVSEAERPRAFKDEF